MSTRDISVAVQNALAASQHVSSFQFIRLDFPSGVLRLHTRIGSFTWTHPVHGSETYLGVGDFGSITADLQETLQGTAKSVNFQLSGVDATLLSTVLTDNTHRQDVELWLGLLDEDHALIDTPTMLWSGVFDKPDIELGQDFGTIDCSAVSRDDIGKESSGVLYTDEQQQLENPGDLGFEYLSQMQDIELRWASSSFNPPRFNTPVFDPNDIRFRIPAF